MSAPIPRPMRAQILYRQGREALWMVNSDGTQNRKLKLAAGGVGTPNWSTDGRTILYLNFPEDKTQFNNLREFTPDTGTDKMIGKTSQFASFGANRDASVFVGASRNNASPAVLLLLRAAHSERTLCEHKSRQRGVGGAGVLARQPAHLFSERPPRQARDLQHARGETGGEDGRVRGTAGAFACEHFARRVRRRKRLRYVHLMALAGRWSCGLRPKLN